MQSYYKNIVFVKENAQNQNTLLNILRKTHAITLIKEMLCIAGAALNKCIAKTNQRK